MELKILKELTYMPLRKVLVIKKRKKLQEFQMVYKRWVLKLPIWELNSSLSLQLVGMLINRDIPSLNNLIVEESSNLKMMVILSKIYKNNVKGNQKDAIKRTNNYKKSKI